MNKQHIVGIIIFTLIVGITVITAGFFIGIPDKKAVTVSDYDSVTYKSGATCRKKKRKKRPRSEMSSALIIKQAVFDAKSEKLNIQMQLEGDSNTDNVNRVALHFFKNDKNGTRHLATEFVDLSSNEMTSEVLSLNWLNNLQFPQENLYIVSEVLESEDSITSLPKFNEQKAVAIVLRGIDNL